MSGELPAARITDPTSHGTPAAPGAGSTDVLIGGLPAWRTMLDTHACPTPTPTPHGPEKIYMGSTTVLINSQMACRMVDILQGLGPPNPVAMGCPTVVIGDAGFGMAKEEPKGAFVAMGQQLLDKWEELTLDERLMAIERVVNATRPLGMTAVLIQELPDSRGSAGEFNYQNWSVDLSPDLLTGSMNKDRMGELVNTAFHEARHAEQWWNAAQHRAARGDSANLIKSSMWIPREVANDAAITPAPDGTSEGAMGESVFVSVYGARSSYRNEVLENLDDEVKYAQYRALPEEEDAWRHGDEVELMFICALRSRS